MYSSVWALAERSRLGDVCAARKMPCLLCARHMAYVGSLRQYYDIVILDLFSCRHDAFPHAL